MHIESAGAVDNSERSIIAISRRSYRVSKLARKPTSVLSGNGGLGNIDNHSQIVLRTEESERKVLKLLQNRARSKALLVHRKFGALIKCFTCLLIRHGNWD